ncbi:hypothetical protein EJB05_57616, partial [Eragrostis curvula]
MGGLSDLDFQRGLEFQDLVTQRFASTVSPLSSSSGFLLVASFSRSAIRIDEHSVSLILQSCLGGTADDFKVSHLKDWCFSFIVSSKHVGFMIYHLRKVLDKSFDLHFTLWRNGGPDWVHELQRWEALQDEEWHHVCRSKKSYAAAVKGNSYQAALNSAKSFAANRMSHQAALNSAKPHSAHKNPPQAALNSAKASVFSRVTYPSDYFLKNYADEARFLEDSRTHHCCAPTTAAPARRSPTASTFTGQSRQPQVSRAPWRDSRGLTSNSKFAQRYSRQPMDQK